MIPLFQLFDTYGLPLDIAISRLRTEPWWTEREEQLHLYLFAGEALRAGWSTRKVQSELRDARALHVKVPETLLA